MPVGVCPLTVLGEFKPFGLIAEALEGGKPPESAHDRYHYFLFDPDVARERDGDTDSDCSSDPPFCHSISGDYELFIRGNRMIWSTGSRVHRRYTSCSPIIMVCWCRMDSISEPLLCVLQTDTLTIYNTSGEIICIPLVYAVKSIWPLPFGLLLQRATFGTRPAILPSPSSSLLMNAWDLSRPSREYVSIQHNFGTLNSSGHNTSGDTSTMSSHLILKHPLGEPEVVFANENGKFIFMRDFDERIIWTSDTIPLVVSYHKGKILHSLWLVENVNSNHEVSSSSSSMDTVPAEVPSKQVVLWRIWQGLCSQPSASKVFLASDDDGVPIICFLLQEQKVLSCFRLQSDNDNNELVDVQTHTSWSIPAIAAAAVIVTRPRVKIGLLPFSDMIVLTSENSLLLYSGKQCLCRYHLPNNLGKSVVSDDVELATHFHDLKIIGLTDAIKSKVNIVLNSGQVFRCMLRRSPSSLTNDCINAMAEGLHPSFYNHFVTLFWGDRGSAYMSGADYCADSEWNSFTNVLMKLCSKCGFRANKPLNTTPSTSWEFLVNSKFHMNYCKRTSIVGICSRTASSASDSSYNLDDQSQEKSFYFQIVMETLDSLHALYETLKLDNLRKQDLELLVVLLCDIAISLHETSYLDHYLRDFPYLVDKFGTYNSLSASRTPPCLFRWLGISLQYGCKFADTSDLPHLICKDGDSVVSWARKIVSFYSLLLGSERIGRRLSTGVYYNIAKGSARTSEELTVLAMVAEGFGLHHLDLLPVGVSLPLRHALEKCRESPPIDWPAHAYVLIGREDLALTCSEPSRKCKDTESQTNFNLVSVSAPHMLHLHPVYMPSSTSDVMGLDCVATEDADSIDGSMVDGMEHMFNASTQLRFGRDLRLNEVRRLLCSARPVAVQTSVNPSASDQDLQQAQLWQLAQRTTSLSLGRGAFTLATTCTLLTEALLVPKLVLAGRLPAQQNATVNLDPNTRNMLELRTWPEFHNGAAAGLRLAPFQGKMSRTWIAYNKPSSPTVSHAGLLLALGLHGHLRDLTIADLYRYLSQEHDTTTVGILLGMAASYRGTMHPAIAKTIYLHIPSRHPSSFPELELPTLLQSAALMAIGLLHEGSAHPLTMKILLGEIGRRSGGDNVLEREGYSVAAGSALGLVALGQGKDNFGSMDTLVDRLLQYIIGKECYSDRSLNPGQTIDDRNRNAGQMMDGTLVNIDVTAPGATIALALMFLKTESEVVASRLSIPHTYFDLQYVRPDFIMLRVIARNLIMWNRIHPSREWVEDQIPEIVRKGVMNIGDDSSDGDDMDVEALIQAYVNIVAGACISLGLRYAGSRNGDAQELLYNYAVYFLNEIKPLSFVSGDALPKGLSQYVDRFTLETCLHLIVLSLTVVMAGSGHLQTFRLLRYLRGRSSADGHASYGIQMAVSLAIGFLFLGGGMRTFSTGNSAIAALLITLYPRLPAGPNDNRCHLQAFRHFYVLATEARWVQTIDVDTGLPAYAPLEVTIRETECHAETSFCEITPCILPERAILKTVQVCGPRYWPWIIELLPEDKPWWKPGDKNDPFNGGILYVKRKVGACSYVDDPLGCQSLLSRAMHKVRDTTVLGNSTMDNIRGNRTCGSFKVDQLISSFSADPSLLAFAQLCCDSSWHNRSDVDFKEFCLQVLFECVSKDRPALLQVYIALFTLIQSMAEQVLGGLTSSDTLFLSSLKLVVAYCEALVGGKLTCAKGGIIQSAFTASINKRVEDILKYSRDQDNLRNYLNSGMWPREKLHGGKDGAVILSWHLQWYGFPSPFVIQTAINKIKSKVPAGFSSVSLLHLLLPRTHINALSEIDKLCFPSEDGATMAMN